ncbi:MAG: phosphoribosylglycinamide formyltransferase [Gluconacetobacter diazotrophicus]|nr:phosphoribosylglycinamide formyltransferase [Gluconacetobacter diazotrophicus]
MARTRVGVLISGRGSNMEALVRAAAAADYPAEIALVLSNEPEAAGLGIAAGMGVAVAAVDHRGFRGDREAHERAMDAVLAQHGVELVCLAGYMRRLTPWLVERWRGRMLNIHPSLLPAFPGLHTHERAIAAGVRVHGCTVHLVTEGVDEGPILAQAAVAVRENDDAASLGARVLTEEHRLYPLALARRLGGEVAGVAGSPEVLLAV